MSLADFAQLLDADPKWVLNACAALGRRPGRYTPALARRFALARALQRGAAMPLRRAFAVAERTLRTADLTRPVVLATADPHVAVTIDVPRLLSALSIRYALRQTTLAPRQRGRPARHRHEPVATAQAWGLDTSLLADNLRKTPQQRLRQLDAMAAFARQVQRQQPGRS